MSKSMKALIAAFLVLACSCSKDALNPCPVNTQIKSNVTSQLAAHFVGEHFGGGIIFYLDSAGQHGLIADETDLGEYTWRPDNIITITGATKTGLGSGKSNTRKIIRSQGMSGTYAALACINSTKAGYTDWYLPSKGELKALYFRRAVIGGFSLTEYWSSTEVNGNSADYAAWTQSFDTGGEGNNYKYASLPIRAIRSF